ncbi:CU044_5270 family protein [Streptosporangium sp. NPDC000095]|uniref:CU044_5270 family protein n=1 Tax=Streptosporangium sp. NPDC000095 TaxID=3366184 RepID=UPI0036825392
MDDRTFARLRPSELDELTEDGYRRRRAGDLARAFATPRTEQAGPARPARPRLRWPHFLMAGTVAAGLAATAVVVTTGGSGADPTGTGPSGAVVASTTQGAPERVADARTFLLAAASTARREPAHSGRYWYVNERTLQKVDNAPGESTAKTKAEPAELPYEAYLADTRETWRAMKAGEVGRRASNQDVKVTFGSPQDEAAWKAAGSPILADDKPRTTDDTFEPILSIDNPSLNLRNVTKLPTGKDELKRHLDDLWKRSPNSAGSGKAVYLWQTGVDLMTAPITPGTRSALFKVLADQPGITSQGEAKDVLGRTGVALSSSAADALTFRLVIDPGTAELLEYDVVQKDVPLLRVALADMGFTDRLGELPKD